MRNRIRFALLFSLLIPLWSTAQAPFSPAKLIQAARAQIGVTLGYDPSYQRLTYPGGDVPMASGVCTDVVIRALRAQKIDLQRLVHEDMRANFSHYPANWGLKRPDSNIDHRRVPNLQQFFQRMGWSLPLPKSGDPPIDTRLQAGDLLSWMLPGNLPHIGIVSDRRAPGGSFLILHNVGSGAQEQDVLHAWPITGHFRIVKAVGR